MTPEKRFKKRYTNRRIGKTKRGNDLLIGNGFMAQEARDRGSHLFIFEDKPGDLKKI